MAEDGAGHFWVTMPLLYLLEAARASEARPAASFKH